MGRRGVFIRIPKTASTSIVKLFGTYVFFNTHNPYETSRKKFLEEGTERAWNGAFKFSFVRNPWDRYVSYFYHQFKRHNPSIDLFPKFIAECVGKFPSRATPGNMIGDNHLDFIGRYENLQHDLVYCAEQMGLPPLGEIPHIQPGEQRRDRQWQNHYDDETRQLVNTWGAWEIERFGYTFEGE